MLSQWFHARIRYVIGVLVDRTLGRTSLSASELTIVCPILTFGACWLLASGAFFWGGWLVLFASAFDMLDGALARSKNQVSHFGSFLDSTLDRYSESLIFLGLLLYYQQAAPGSNEVLLIYLAIIGSLLISYSRARAESLNFDCKVGLLERPERILLIVFGLVTGWIHLVLWALAILTHVTAIQRCVYVWQQSRSETMSSRSIGPAKRGEQQ